MAAVFQNFKFLAMKRVVVILLLATAGRAHAQEFKPFFSAIIVANIDSSISWYKKVLGLELRNRTDAPDRGFIQANLFNKNILIELIQVDSSVAARSMLANY